MSEPIYGNGIYLGGTGLPSGGTAGQVLKKTNEGAAWGDVPTDTTRQAKITASGILKGDGNGNVSAAVAGTDYIATTNITMQTLVSAETNPTQNGQINWVYG